MNYLGEHTFIGIFGHFFIILGFVTAFLSAIAFFLSEQNSHASEKIKLKKLARNGFMVHSAALLLVVFTIFYMIANHYFEYNYVWKYSNRAMEWKYMFSCFWSGQEGSFLLWSFWVMIAGWLLMRDKNTWEAPVMSIVAIFQVIVFSMLLGLYVGDVKIGSSPFILIRQLPENAMMPWTQMPDYLTRIEEFNDGIGLNPLLQNYWMTIHPPTLFLGFGLCLIPFAFAASGLWRGEFTSWVKPALPWTFAAVAVLAAGILMGGAWAYEALSFGGFWAWDPVENASLVPWVILIAAAHCMLIVQSRKKGVFAAAFLAIFAFVFVVYSGFLTRSGILGDSSVHSFTDNGMMAQLIFMLLFFFSITVMLPLAGKKLRRIFLAFTIVLGAIMVFIDFNAYTFVFYLGGCIVFIILGYRSVGERSSEDAVLSREFWMFLGVLVLCISALQITVTTSIPVINWIFETRYDAFTNLELRNQFYKLWQLPFAIAITFFLAVSQFLRYGNTPSKWLVKKMLIPFIVSLVVAATIAYLNGFSWKEMGGIALLFTTVFAISSNVEYLRKKNFVENGSAIAHIGFAVLLMGALISMMQSEAISENTSDLDVSLLNKEFKNKENILLKKGEMAPMHDYFVSYEGKHQEGVNIFYNVAYYEKLANEEAGKHLFTLKPFVQLNEKFGNVPEPGTKSFLTHDIFTHVKWADLEVLDDEAGLDDDFMGLTMMEMTLNKTYNHENLQLILEAIELVGVEDGPSDVELNEDDIIIKASLDIRLLSDTSTSYSVIPFYVVRDSSMVIPTEVYSPELDTWFSIKELNSQPNTLVIGLQEREYIVMSATRFPLINLLWTGCILLVFGSGLAAYSRCRKKLDKNRAT